MVSRSCLSCGAVIPRGPRCAACTSKLNVERGSSTNRGYSSRWRRISERQRARVPWCEVRLPGCTRVATAADHIVPLEQGGRSTARNARSACTSCNNRRRYVENTNV